MAARAFPDSVSRRFFQLLRDGHAAPLDTPPAVDARLRERPFGLPMQKAARALRRRYPPLSVVSPPPRSAPDFLTRDYVGAGLRPWGTITPSSVRHCMTPLDVVHGSRQSGYAWKKVLVSRAYRTARTLRQGGKASGRPPGARVFSHGYVHVVLYNATSRSPRARAQAPGLWRVVRPRGMEPDANTPRCPGTGGAASREAQRPAWAPLQLIAQRGCFGRHGRGDRQARACAFGARRGSGSSSRGSRRRPRPRRRRIEYEALDSAAAGAPPRRVAWSSRSARRRPRRARAETWASRRREAPTTITSLERQQLSSPRSSSTTAGGSSPPSTRPRKMLVPVVAADGRPRPPISQK